MAETRRLAGWGRTRQATMPVASPRSEAELTAAIRSADSVIACGNGRSYGDPHLNTGGAAILTAGLDRILAFDEADGTIVCEAGVTFDRLMREFLPRGWLVPVTPGTAFATIGGAVANDVHGKNHDRVGAFGDHLLWLDLVVASGEVARVSPAEDPELFAATIGGIGLTGIVLRAAFRMQPVRSAGVDLSERRIPDLEAFIDAFAAVRGLATHSVGWIDGLARGRALGRGILETAEPAPAFEGRPRERGLRVPCDFPAVALNPMNVGLFNALYFRRVPAAGRTRRVHARRFFYPLDAILAWNRIYGRRGFYQFQCVLPDGEARRGLRRLLETISAARSASFLAVLKTLGGEGRGHLSFPMRGYTLALDFPRRPGTESLLADLERIALDHGGRVYLAKDAVLSPAPFARMYPKLEAFRAVLARVDPDARFRSDMARRLRIRPET